MLIGLVMAFGVGTLLSSIAYELVPEALASVGDVLAIAIAIPIGSLVFFLATGSSRGWAARAPRTRHPSDLVRPMRR